MEQVLVKSMTRTSKFSPLTTIIALGRFTPSPRRVVYCTNNLFFPFVFWPAFGLAYCLLFYAGIHMNIAPCGISLCIVWGWKSLQKPFVSACVGSGPEHQYRLVYHITSRTMTPNQEGDPRTHSWATHWLWSKSIFEIYVAVCIISKMNNNNICNVRRWCESLHRRAACFSLESMKSQLILAALKDEWCMPKNTTYLIVSCAQHWIRGCQMNSGFHL